MDYLLYILLGIGLAAACGFRVFVPLLVMRIAARTGHLSLARDFAWLGSWPALVTFAIATTLEIAGYLIPWFDHLLDTIATPAAIIAGVVVTASVVTDMSPSLRWTLAIIAGGGIAGAIQFGTMLLRRAAGYATAGLGHPFAASAETGGSIGMALLSLFLPAFAAVLALLLIVALVWLAARLRRGKRRVRESQ
jgi:hypothetical protein